VYDGLCALFDEVPGLVELRCAPKLDDLEANGVEVDDLVARLAFVGFEKLDLEDG